MSDNEPTKKNVTVFMDKKLIELLKGTAKRTNRSFSYVVNFLVMKGVAEYVARDKAKDPKQKDPKA